MAATSYRPDIDGLRGLAMFPILFLHAGLSLTPGGFIGVDIFFVISGYLIIDIVRNQLADGKFSLFDFMSRRVRRIFPAAFTTVFFTLLAGWFLLGPYDYQELARSARYNVLFSANHFFWMQDGYWDTASQLKPLLHTWSLAVEEQFYFLLPLFMIATFRFRENIRLLLMLLIALASFIASVWSVEHAPSSAYFLLHSRAWEILIGGLLTYIPKNTGSKPWLSELIGGAGLLTIIALFFVYDHKMPFPGFAGLAPTLATAALIWGGPYNLGSRLLSAKIMVYFGRMTYSWYLIHWPLIAYANYWYGDDLTLSQTVAILLASFVLAHFSRKYVEESVLKKKIFKTNKSLISTAICLVLLTLMVVQTIKVHEGFPERLPKLSQQYHSARIRSAEVKRCSAVSAEQVDKNQLCRLGKKVLQDTPQYITWGDSHNASLLPLYDSLADDYGIAGWHAARIACPPLLGLQWKKNPECNAFNAAMLETIKKNHIANVVLASRWTLPINGDDKGEMPLLLEPPQGMTKETYYQQLLEKTIADIRATGARVWIVKQVPTHPFEPPKHLAVLAMKGKNTVGLGKSFALHMQQVAFVNSIFDRAIKDPGVNLIDPVPLFCSDKIVCRTENDGWSLYRDDHHVSTYGALYLKPMMQQFVREMTGGN